MDFHKPKPIHNWRDFLKEVGIIVLGVCIALAAEQAVEWLHWRGEVEIGRKAIAAEMNANNRFYARRVAIAPCLDRMIGEADAIITAIENKGKAASFTTFHLGQGQPLSESEWQSERSSQVLTHFPRAELALMSRYYALVEETTAWMLEENEAWKQLSVLQSPPAGLSPDAIGRLRVSLASARQMAYRFLLNSRRQLDLSVQLGLPRATPEPGRVDGFCKVKNDEQFWSAMLKTAAQP